MELNIVKIFEYGVDYGLLLAEQERQGEELFDAFQGSAFSAKFAMPSAPAERRQLRSDKWFEAKKKSLVEFAEIYSKVIKSDEFIFIHKPEIPEQ